ncbi:MAG: pirin family protein [Euzebya sp.]
MSAVTADTMTLPRISAAQIQQSERPVRKITTAPAGHEGEGFPVRRTMAGLSYRDLDPFIMMDQMGEVEYQAGEPKGTSWHPHRGFETVTYLIDGQFVHQDTHGGGGIITEGATQWMTAGSGLMHIETPPEQLVQSGGLFHGFQLWVNLPADKKFTDPRYQGLDADTILLLSGADATSLVRVIAGEVDGHRGPGSTHTPITVVHASVSPGGTLSLPWQPTFNALAYVMAGTGTIGAERHPITAGQMAVLGEGDRIVMTADQTQESRTQAMEVIVLGGRPIREPMEHYGPFVMNTREQLIQTLEDFQRGRLGIVPPDAIMPHVYQPRN